MARFNGQSPTADVLPSRTDIAEAHGEGRINRDHVPVVDVQVRRGVLGTGVPPGLNRQTTTHAVMLKRIRSSNSLNRRENSGASSRVADLQQLSTVTAQVTIREASRKNFPVFAPSACPSINSP